MYAFGLILYEMCTLKMPKLGLEGLSDDELPSMYSIELRSLISSLLSRSRGDRPTASQVKQDLSRMSSSGWIEGLLSVLGIRG